MYCRLLSRQQFYNQRRISLSEESYFNTFGEFSCWFLLIQLLNTLITLFQELKSRYGQGYNVIIKSKDNTADKSILTGFMRMHFSDAKLEVRHFLIHYSLVFVSWCQIPNLKPDTRDSFNHFRIYVTFLVFLTIYYNWIVLLQYLDTFLIINYALRTQFF